MDNNDYRDMVQRMYARQKAVTNPNSAAAQDLALFIYVVARLKDSWRDLHPGGGQPHLFFTGLVSASPDGSQVTCERVWAEAFLDDPAAARAAQGNQVVLYDHCVRQSASCCKAERPVIGSLDARGGLSSPLSLPTACFATLCHTCLRASPLKI